MRRALTVFLLVILALARSDPAAAFSAPPTKPLDELLDRNDPYQAYDIVAGYDVERTRRVGFAHCLPEVLVRVSGEPRLEGDPRVAALAARADHFVASYDYSDFLVRMGPVHDDQGTGDERPYDLVVRFDRAKIDAALKELGVPPWQGARPQVVPVLAITGFSRSYLLSAEVKAGAEQRGALAVAAEQYGLPLRVPSEAELAAWGVATGGMPSPRAEPKEGRALVTGTLTFDEAKPGWVGAYTMRWHGTDSAWGISGVNYDAAFRALMRGVARVASGRGAPD